MTGRDQVNIERVRYWQGQRLRARDLRTQTVSEAELRWWHNRAVHNTFGIRAGFIASPVIANSTLVAVRVACGIAYDCFGRELILQRDRQVEVPNIQTQKPATIKLIAEYRQTPPRLARRSVAEAPAFLWRSAAECERDEGVSVARLRYLPSATLEVFPTSVEFPALLNVTVRYNSSLKRLVSTRKLSEAERKTLLDLSQDNAYRAAVNSLVDNPEFVPVFDDDFRPSLTRAASRPRIGRGDTVPGDTPWELWKENVIGSEITLGVQVTIDTSASGFTQTPVYFASLQGTLWNRTNVEFFPVVFPHIDNESISGFRFRIWLPRIISWTGSRARFANSTFDTAFLNFAREQRLFVCWLGIECHGDEADEPTVCPEVPDCCCTEEA
jgi:hypothetical protein